MDRIIRFIEMLLPMAYLACAALYAVGFVNPNHRAARPARRMLEGTLLAHLLYLVLVAQLFDRVPMASLFELLSCLALATAAVYLYLERRLAEKSVGMFILSISFVFQLLSSGLMVHPAQTPELLHGPAIALHLGAGLISYAAFTISAVFALMYLMLYHEIRQHRFGLIYSRMPNLDVMASFCAHGVLLGFVFLSLAMVAGAFRAHGAEFEYAWYHDPKVLSVAIIWVVYGVLAGLVAFRKWRGRRVAFFSLAGYGVALVSLLFVNFLSGFHEFH